MFFGTIIALLSMLAWGFGDFFIQKSSRKIGSLETLASIGLVGVIGLLPFVIGNISSLLYSWRILLVLGILSFTVSILNFEALKSGKLSVVEVLFELELPITVLLAVIILKENVSVVQIILFLLILAGIVSMSLRKFSFVHLKTGLEKGIFLALFTAFGLAMINFFTAAAATKVSPMVVIWTCWTIYTVACIITIIVRKEQKGFLNNMKKNWKLLIITGILDTAGWVFYATSTTINGLAITTGITESYPAVALFLGVYVNKEKIKTHQYIAALIVLTVSIILCVQFSF